MDGLTVAGEPLTRDHLIGLAFVSALALGGLAYWGRVFGSVRRLGGWVNSAEVRPADIVGAALIVNFFVLLALSLFFAAHKASPSTTPVKKEEFSLVKQVIELLIMHGVILGLIAISFIRRGTKLGEFLGLTLRNQWKRLGTGLLLLVATMPIVFLLSLGWTVILTALGFPPQEQEPVRLMREASDLEDRLLLICMAVIIAPLAEELIFRGYLYPVAKRFVGMWPAIIGTGLLFGLIHGNLAAAVPLTLLGIGLALAYEHTGSILTPWVMHTIFNTTTTLILLFGPTPAPPEVPAPSPTPPITAPAVPGQELAPAPAP